MVDIDYCRRMVEVTIGLLDAMEDASDTWPLYHHLVHFAEQIKPPRDFLLDYEVDKIDLSDCTCSALHVTTHTKDCPVKPRVDAVLER